MSDKERQTITEHNTLEILRLTREIHRALFNTSANDYLSSNQDEANDFQANILMMSVKKHNKLKRG